jgi:predicted enzyme related to lactoylglutathione lyase
MQSAPIHGEVAWVGLAAADLTAAVEFYTAAFGWEAARDAAHTTLRRAGTDLALVYPQTSAARAANVTPHWSPFFFVTDAAEAKERAVQSHGVALRGPFEVPGGWVVAMRDPAGAVVSIWAPRPSNAPQPTPSDAWWLELSTPDVEASQAFYRRLLGWSYDEDPHGASIRGPEARIGRMRAVERRPGWSPCLRVANVEEARRRAESASAGSIGDIEEDAMGRRVSIVDPQGASLTLLEQA